MKKNFEMMSDFINDFECDVHNVIKTDNFMLWIRRDTEAMNPVYFDNNLSDIYMFYDVSHYGMDNIAESSLSALRTNVMEYLEKNKDNIIDFKKIYMLTQSPFTLSFDDDLKSFNTEVVGVSIVRKERFHKRFKEEYNGSFVHIGNVRALFAQELYRLCEFMNKDVYEYILFENISETGLYKECDVIDKDRNLWNFIGAGCGYYGGDHNENGLFDSIRSFSDMNIDRRSTDESVTAFMRYVENKNKKTEECLISKP